MKLKALLLGAAIALLPATAATAQSFMDLPGMGAATGSLPEHAESAGRPSARASGDSSFSTAQVEPEDPLELPGSGALPVGGSSAQTEDEEAAPDPAPRTASSRDDELPKSGSAVAALALVGLALVASGRLLREFTKD